MSAKQVSFKKDDNDIIEYMKEKGYHKTFSYYVKGLIRKDMEEDKNKGAKKTTKRNANFNL